MNKNDRAERNSWRDTTKQAVAQAKIEEEARSKEERDTTGRRDFLLERTRELVNLGSCGGDERATKELWISKLILGKTPANNPDAPRIAPRYEAWPVDELPEWLTKHFANEHWLWNALALPIQQTISRIRIQQREVVSAVYKEAESKGLDTQEDQVRKKLGPRIKAALKDVDFSQLQKIVKARKITLEEAGRIRKGEITDPEAEMRRLGWTKPNWNFAVAVSSLPAWLQRIVEKRIRAGSKTRGTRREGGAGEKWWKGYPRLDFEERSEEGRLDVYFNNQNLAWCAGEMTNSYLDISKAWNPPGHHGPRKGKYRSLREMRKVTIYEPGASANAKTKKASKNRLSLNVLFHAVATGAKMKEYKLRTEKDGYGKLHWFFIPTFELPTPSAAEHRTFAGVDLGLRQAGSEEIKAVHVWDSSRGYKCYPLRAVNNRWAKRYNKRQEKLPEGERFAIEMTQAGMRDFASRKGSLQRDFKARMGEILKAHNQLPANWDRIGKRGIGRMMTQDKSSEFATLQGLRPEYEAWAKRDKELVRIYGISWQMVTENLDTQRRKVAREILSGVTDAGVEAMDWKRFAEEENAGTSNWERHIENVIDRNRQHSGPAKFKMILGNLARKTGKRIHWIAPAYTTKTCSACGHVNEVGKGERFSCGGCGRQWNRDDNAARNFARLGRECAGGDTHPLRCSRDGKTLAFHGFRVPASQAARGQSGKSEQMLAKKTGAASKDRG